MTLKEILENKGSKVWAVRENQTVQDAIQVLAHRKIGAVLVLSPEGKIQGILSERDIVRGLSYQNASPQQLEVQDLMTRRVIVASPEDEVHPIMSIMTENRIRHIPVVSNGELQGIVSIGDVVKALLQESAYEVRSLKEFIYGSAVS